MLQRGWWWNLLVESWWVCSQTSTLCGGGWRFSNDAFAIVGLQLKHLSLVFCHSLDEAHILSFLTTAAVQWCKFKHIYVAQNSTVMQRLHILYNWLLKHGCKDIESYLFISLHPCFWSCKSQSTSLSVNNCENKRKINWWQKLLLVAFLLDSHETNCEKIRKKLINPLVNQVVTETQLFWESVFHSSRLSNNDTKHLLFPAS